MASEGINTALGFPAGVLPQSGFNPLEYALGKAGESRRKEEAKFKEIKKKEAEDLNNTLNSINANLGRSKWFSYYANEGQQLQDNYRQKNVDLYKKQGGVLTPQQISQNKVEQEDIKARVAMVDFTYNKLQDLKKAMLTNQKLNTPENQEKIRRFENPFDNDQERLKEAGGFLEYINKNFPILQEKAEPVDYNKLFGEVSANIKPDIKETISGTDPLTGKARIDITEEQDVVDYQDALREVYRTNQQRFAQNYPTEDSFIQAGMRYQQGTEKKLRLVKKEDQQTPVTAGGATSTGEVKLAEYNKRIGTEGGKKSDIPVRGIAFSKKDKPLRLDLLSDQIGVLSNKGFQKTDELGRNIQFQASGVDYVPVLNEVINFKDIPKGLAKDQLMKYIKEQTKDKDIIIGERFDPAKLEEGLPLNSSIINIFEKLGLSDIVDEVPYVYGTVSGLEELPGEEEVSETGEVVKGKSKIRPGKGKSYYIPYSEVAPQLKLHGVELETPQRRGVPETTEEGLRGQGEATQTKTVGIQGTGLEGKPDGTKVRNKAGEVYIKRGDKLVKVQ